MARVWIIPFDWFSPPQMQHEIELRMPSKSWCRPAIFFKNGIGWTFKELAWKKSQDHIFPTRWNVCNAFCTLKFYINYRLTSINIWRKQPVLSRLPSKSFWNRKLKISKRQSAMLLHSHELSNKYFFNSWLKILVCSSYVLHQNAGTQGTSLTPILRRGGREVNASESENWHTTKTRRASPQSVLHENAQVQLYLCTNIFYRYPKCGGFNETPLTQWTSCFQGS